MSKKEITPFKQESFKRAIGHIVYKNYELRYLKRGELETIHLSRLEFELLVDNEHGQNQLIKRHGGDTLIDLVALFRNESNTTFTVNFNSKKVKIYNFTNNVDELMFVTDLNYKKVYSEFLLV